MCGGKWSDEEISITTSVSPAAAGDAPAPSSHAGALSWLRWLFFNLDNAARAGDSDMITSLLQALAAAAAAAAPDHRLHQQLDLTEALVTMSAAVWSDPDIVRALMEIFIIHNEGQTFRDSRAAEMVNKRDPATGQRPLHIATHLGHRVAVRALLAYGADVNAVVDPTPVTSHHASPGGVTAVADGSISDFAFPKTLLQGMTALHWAALRGYSEIVEDLVVSGADLNSRVSRSGETALHLAARRGGEAVVGVLLDAGCNTSVRSSSNLSPMDLAALSNHPGTLRAFLCRGVDPDEKNAVGYTPLHQAAYNNSCDTLKVLLDWGASVNSATTVRGYTPLHVAAMFSTTTSSSRALPPPPPPPSTGTFNASTPVSPASRLNRSSSIKEASTSAVRTIGRYGKLLLEVDAVDVNGWTPLRMACVNLREEAVRDLLDMGADEALVKDLLVPSAEGEDPFVGATLGDSRSRANANFTATAGAPSGRVRAESIARIRAMLAAAQADKAWRRRGWLVTLRARNIEAGRAAADGRIETRSCSNDGTGCGKRGSWKRSVPSCPSVSRRGGGVDHLITDTVEGRSSGGKAARRGNELGDGAGGVNHRAQEGRHYCFAELVEKMTALEDEGVFRKVALFL